MSGEISYGRLNPPERTLLGPDLSNASPRARQGLIGVLEGAGDPSFLGVLEGSVRLLRWLWGTKNADTFILPGSEETALMAGMANMIEPGDRVVVGISGFFGERMAETARRLGAEVVPVRAPPGADVAVEDLEHALNSGAVSLVALLHGDGSTGVVQSLSGLGELAHRHSALLLLDTRWTTGALAFNLDELQIDICLAGSQKAMSAYPGLGLISFSARAVQRHQARKSPVVDWALDLANLRLYSSDERSSQTVPAPLLYAFTEMLQLAYEQDMAYRERRHVNRRDALVAAVEALGLDIFAQSDCRLPTVTAIKVPQGIQQDRIRERLLVPYRIDIGGGLGALKGEVWRVGVMSHSAQPTFLLSFITLLEIILEEEGYPIPQRGHAVRTLLEKLDP